MSASGSPSVSVGGIVGSVTGAAPGKKVTVYEKLNVLNEEISDCIIATASDAGITKEAIESELRALREASFRERSPEAEYAIKLFRKYVDQTGKSNPCHPFSRGSSTNMQNIPLSKGEYSEAADMSNHEFMKAALEGTYLQIAGPSEAAKKNIFWFRAIIMLLSLVALIILSSSRYIAYTKFTASNAFTVQMCIIVDMESLYR
jgi:hypothetical protein